MALRLATQTLDVRRRNISRVVFYPDIKLAYNRIGKSGNSSVVLYLSDALKGKQNEISNYKESKKKCDRPWCGPHSTFQGLEQDFKTSSILFFYCCAEPMVEDTLRIPRQNCGRAHAKVFLR